LIASDFVLRLVGGDTSMFEKNKFEERRQQQQRENGNSDEKREEQSGNAEKENVE